MPTYSEWYEREVVGDVSGTMTDGKKSVGEGSDGPYDDENYGDPTAINNAILDAIANQTIGTDGGLTYRVRIQKFLVTSLPMDYDRKYDAVYGTINRYFTASYVPLGNWEPTLPEGATGWEYDYSSPRVTSAVLHMDFGAGMTDSSNGGGLPAGGSADLEVRVHNGGTWVGSNWAGPYDGVRTGPLVAAESIYRTPGFGLLREADVTDQLADEWPGRIVFDMGVAHGSPPIPTDDSGGSTLEMDNGVILSMTYTFTIAYRFIYPDEPTFPRQPPLRVVQRGNDGLGFTGGRRVVGTKTLQSSNRRGSAIR